MLIDGLILALLAGTLAYAWLVDRRVRVLMQTLRDLQPMVGEFSAAVDKSESSVDHLRSVAREMAERQARAGAAPASPAPAADRAERRIVPPGVTRVNGKADLVRSFFEATRGGQT
ncbi:NUDIX hydrolase [Mesobaculum littorinae]|nr:flagellar motor switch protein [Mesobaculum littorinae]